jgi:hypothetical protein
VRKLKCLIFKAKNAIASSKPYEHWLCEPLTLRPPGVEASGAEANAEGAPAAFAKLAAFGLDFRSPRGGECPDAARYLFSVIR